MANEPPSLVSHFLYSKKALQHGQNLCSHVNALRAESASNLVDALALETKLKLVTNGVLEQLTLASAVARNLSQQRTRLVEEARGWDALRTERNQSLDAVLESLEAQHVPPALHQITSGSSLFGSQHSLTSAVPDASPSRNNADEPVDPKARWKTLRDFVDERGIEEVLENMEEDRNNLDDVLSTTSAHPATLTKHITDIRSSLPAAIPSPVKQLDQLLADQEGTATNMASHLESLAAHYDQVSQALREEEAGVTLSHEDMEVFVRDNAELPSIIDELESSVTVVGTIRTNLVSFRDACASALEPYSDIMSRLEALETTMDTMLEAHEQVRINASQIHTSLEGHYHSLQQLEETYHNYQLAYDYLILEMDRRSKYRSQLTSVIKAWEEKLRKAREEETSARERFIAEHGAFLPDDLCPYVADLPARWTLEEDGMEGVVDLEESVVNEARRNVGQTGDEPEI